MDDSDGDPLLTAYMARRGDLLRYFRIRLRSDEAAQDLVQDIFLKISNRAPEEINNPAAYLYRLGTNLMLDHLKKERRLERRTLAWTEAHGQIGEREVSSEDPPADEAVAARERLKLVIEAVGELPPTVQRAFRLHKLEGLSHAETASAMGVSRSSVEKYLMTSLKQILAKVGR